MTLSDLLFLLPHVPHRWQNDNHLIVYTSERIDLLKDSYTTFDTETGNAPVINYEIKLKGMPWSPSLFRLLTDYSYQHAGKTLRNALK
jgi:hypothetical protein